MDTLSVNFKDYLIDSHLVIKKRHVLKYNDEVLRQNSAFYCNHFSVCVFKLLKIDSYSI